jgi:hypothetical protein
MFRTRRRTSTRRDGCGFLVLTCLFTCFFLVLNSGLVSRFYWQLADAGPEFLRNPRVAQMLMFLGPVMLLFLEWWIVDFIVESLTPRRRTGRGGNAEADGSRTH